MGGKEMGGGGWVGRGDVTKEMGGKEMGVVRVTYLPWWSVLPVRPGGVS